MFLVPKLGSVRFLFKGYSFNPTAIIRLIPKNPTDCSNIKTLLGT